jgi:hypothetical protein
MHGLGRMMVLSLRRPHAHSGCFGMLVGNHDE